MAPKSGEFDEKESLTRDNSSSESGSGEIWGPILKMTASQKIVLTKNLLILGDRESGKSSLIRHLKGVEDEVTFEGLNANDTMSKSVGTSTDEISSSNKSPKNDLALSYTFVEVKDDEAEDTLARLGIYQLAGSHESYHPLLRFALNCETLPDSLVVIVLDWSRPWTFIETLQRWIKFLEVGIESIKSEGDSGAKGWTKGKAALDELKDSIQRFIQNYSEPGSTDANVTTVNSESEEDVALPLGDGVLKTDWAVPLVIVCTKSDSISDLERELDYKEEQLDYIQQSLRTICLKYGAALFYTTTRKPQTYTSLRKYILHRLLGSKNSSSDTKSAYSFNIKANYVDERDAVLIPTGWDSWRKIKFLKEEFNCEELLQGWDLDMGGKPTTTSEEGTGEKISAKKVYEEVIDHEDLDKPLLVQTTIEAEDEQEFFKRHFETLQRANSERPPPPSVVGPMGAPSYPYGDIGADVPDLDNVSIPSTVPSTRPKTSNAKAPSPSPSISPVVPNGNPTSIPANGSAPNQNQNQNEVLATFFQNLLSKKNPGATSGTSQPSSNESASNPVITNKSNRKLVEKELDKLRNGSPAASMAGK